MSSMDFSKTTHLNTFIVTICFLFFGAVSQGERSHTPNQDEHNTLNQSNTTQEDRTDRREINPSEPSASEKTSKKMEQYVETFLKKQQEIERMVLFPHDILEDPKDEDVDSAIDERDKASEDIAGLEESMAGSFDPQEIQKIRDKVFNKELELLKTQLQEQGRKLKEMEQKLEEAKKGGDWLEIHKAEKEVAYYKDSIQRLQKRSEYNNKERSGDVSLVDHFKRKPSENKPKTTYIVTVGPDLKYDPESKDARNEMQRLARIAAERNPGTKFEFVEKFTPEALKAKVSGTGQEADKRIVLINAHGKKENGKYKVLTEEGWKDGSRLLKDLNGDKNTDYLLWTCHAGQCDIKPVKGSVFGMSPAHEPGNGLSVTAWRHNLETKTEESFPTSAKEFYDSYLPVNKPSAGPQRFWVGQGESYEGMKYGSDDSFGSYRSPSVGIGSLPSSTRIKTTNIPLPSLRTLPPPINKPPYRRPFSYTKKISYEENGGDSSGSGGISGGSGGSGSDYNQRRRSTSIFPKFELPKDNTPSIWDYLEKDRVK